MIIRIITILLILSSIAQSAQIPLTNLEVERNHFIIYQSAEDSLHYIGTHAPVGGYVTDVIKIGYVDDIQLNGTTRLYHLKSKFSGNWDNCLTTSFERAKVLLQSQCWVMTGPLMYVYMYQAPNTTALYSYSSATATLREGVGDHWYSTTFISNRDYAYEGILCYIMTNQTQVIPIDKNISIYQKWCIDLMQWIGK
jgi:hypothetical protein